MYNTVHPRLSEHLVHISEEAIDCYLTLSVDNFERVSDAVRRCLKSRSSTFQTLSEHSRFLIRTRLASCSNAFTCSFSFEHIWLLIRKRLASHSKAFGFSFEQVWLFIRTRFIQWPNKSRLWSKRVHTRSERIWTKSALYLVPDGDCIWCSSIDRFDNFELFIDCQHYSTSFKLLYHSSHFAKILFNRQRDYCACAIKPRLCSDNRGFI